MTSKTGRRSLALRLPATHSSVAGSRAWIPDGALLGARFRAPGQAGAHAAPAAPWSSVRNVTRASIAACALVYFVIGKVAFEPRLAFGTISVNQLLQIVVMVGLAALLWCGDLRRTARSRTLWLVGALALLLSLGAVGAQNTFYAPAKPLGYLGLVLPAFAVFAASLRSEADVRRFLMFWALVGTGMMLLGLALLFGGDAPPRLGVFGGGSNGYARMVGTAFLLWAGLDTRLGSTRLRVWQLLLPGVVVTMLFAGSKAAILGLGIAVVALGWYRRDRKLLFGALLATTLFASAPLWTHRIVGGADKNRGEVRMFTTPDTADPRGSYGTRMMYYKRSAEYLKQGNWLGVGTGEWHTVVGLPSGRRHPHNMELELGCELGILGLLWLATMLVVGARWVRNLYRSDGDRRPLAALIAVLAFWSFNAQLNGDLLDNRWIWLAILLVEIIAMQRQPAATRSSSDVLEPQVSAL